MAEGTLQMRPRNGGGFIIVFPDGEGGELQLTFVPDLSSRDLIIEAGRPDEPPTESVTISFN